MSKFQTLVVDIEDILLTSQGPTNALTVKEIAYILDMELKHETGPNIRQAIRQLITDGHPIGASNRGYYYIDTFKDLREYLHSLDDRIVALERRKKAMIKAYVKARQTPATATRELCIALVHDIAHNYKMHYSAVYMLAYRLLEKKLDKKIQVNDKLFVSILKAVEAMGVLDLFYQTLREVEDMLI